MRKIISLNVIICLIFSATPVFGKSKKSDSSSLNLKEFALPSEVEGLIKTPGTVFYSPVVKGKVLIPVHIWGEVQKPGLHFIPIGATLIDGLSMAGGLTAQADEDSIRLTHQDGEKLNSSYFDLSEGGDNEAFLTELRPRDTIFAERSTFREDRSYYTSLIGVVATILSSILILDQIKKN
tara:strand:+ start:70 stop:609 length:540 start_codon:yes stop_codon:yes gene_type:complete